MGSRLIEGWRKTVASDKALKACTREAEFDVMYPTGFITLDHMNGTRVHVHRNGIDLDYKAIGIVDGSANTFISRPGCGKSTLVTQIIGNLLRAFPESEAYIDDIEGSLPMPRKEFLLGLPEEELKTRVFFRNTDITTENVYGQIKWIHDQKINARAEFEYDTGLYDTYGNRIFKLRPTFYFIDSFAMLMPDDILEGEMDKGMGATATAKKNTQLVKKISQLLKAANIVLFTINHINDDVNTGFMPKPVQIDGLKQGERMPGGKAVQYLANNLFRMDQRGTLKEEEGYGIFGTVIDVSSVKSRTNASKKMAIPLIFDKTNGKFDNILSIYHYLKTEGYVGGAGRSMFFNNAPDIKFSQKEFKQKLYSSPELQKAFAEISKEAMERMLSDTMNKTEEANMNDNINNLILGLSA